MTLDVLPGEAVGPVRLGMTRDEARAALDAQPEVFTRGDTTIDAYFGSALQVNIDGGDRVEFIEVAGTFELPISVLGFDPFELEREALVAELEARLGEPATVEEDGATYTFNGLVLWGWDDETAEHFESVAVFGPGYYELA